TGHTSHLSHDTATPEIYTLSLHDALPIYVEAPALVDHEPLVQPEQGEGARAVLADPALVERAGQGRILPRARLEAHARGGGIAILAVGELLGGKEPQLVVDLERGVDLHPGGEVDAVVLAAEAHFGLR